MNNLFTKHDGRPAYLLVIPSSCQMYSGTGTAIFDWIRYAKNVFEFSILIDTFIPKNFNIVREFCEAEGVGLLSSPGILLPGCVDLLIKDIPKVILNGGFEYVECVSWANAAVNLQVLASIQRQTILAFTPHTQPLWTLRQGANTICIVPAFKRMLERSDVIFLDSKFESHLPLFDGHHLRNASVVPLGVDTSRFFPEGDHRSGDILFVGDFGERRKRIDLLFAAFSIALARKPELKLFIAGKGSDSCEVPPLIASSVRRFGYIGNDELVNLYRRADIFLMTSDFEAFGLPIAEALCCGTRVLVNNQGALIELFGDLSGVAFAQNINSEAVAEELLTLCASPMDRIQIAEDARKKFEFSATYGKKMLALRAVSSGNIT